MSHWGPFSAEVDDRGEVVAVRPDARGPGAVATAGQPRRCPAPSAARPGADGPPRLAGARPRPGRSAAATDEYVALPRDDMLDRLAAELTRVYGGPGPEAVYGGSYGWSSAGRFHHAQGQLHRFLNALGGYVRSVNTYSVGTSEVLLPHVFGRRPDVLRSLTSWPLLAAHTVWGSRMSRTPVTSGDRLAPMLGHDHRRVAAAVVSDLPAGARADPAAGPLVLHQGRRAPRAAPRGRCPSAQQPETTYGLGGPSDLRRPHPAAAPNTALPPPGHPEHDPALASAPRAQEAGGTRTGPDGHRSTTSSPRW